MKRMKVLLILALVFSVFVACAQIHSVHPFPKDMEGIEEFPYPFKLPTYLPYSVEKVEIVDYMQTVETLPDDIAQTQANDFVLTVGVKGASGENLLFIEIKPFEELNEIKENNSEVILSNNDTQAKYSYREDSQTMTWNDKELNYSIIGFLSSNGNKLYERKELEKMANSFEVYNTK
ncbi:hypothetical protein [Sutcliffiella horikoshii]|uniref:hypothetical protein n=1 Tax=Sutcliffiella horikoshii TaxID=79883 RepID=UPI001F32A3C9|nr:hypothetical protein [Sutcliffiella horikoshii]MCG1023417.1 hypothetical protein [Sutcliffiella horikoshii]